MEDLKGKIVLITGASSGIGASAARAFGKAGARVAVHYKSSQAQADAVASTIRRSGAEAITFKADITRTAEIENLITDVEKAFGGIDVLINNAGGFVRRSTIVNTSDDYVDQVFNLNARCVVTACRYVIPIMSRAGGGTIINVTTQAARTGGGPGAGLYAACKGFVSTITRTMAKELVKDSIRVNAVAPGVIDTSFHTGHSSPEVLTNFANSVPMGRIGTADECAGAFLFLASAQLSGYVTGQIIEVNGGQVMP